MDERRAGSLAAPGALALVVAVFGFLVRSRIRVAARGWGGRADGRAPCRPKDLSASPPPPRVIARCRLCPGCLCVRRGGDAGGGGPVVRLVVPRAAAALVALVVRLFVGHAERLRPRPVSFTCLLFDATQVATRTGKGWVGCGSCGGDRKISLLTQRG